MIVTEFEHHSNFVPWQQAAKRTGAEFVVIPMREDGRLDIEALERELDESVVIVSVTAISNVTGTVLPVREIIQKAHPGVCRCFPGNPARSDECAGTGL